jgi:hypothetical protein
MGMFDQIECQYPLPGDPPEFARKSGHRFQTKDFGCVLATYRIAEDGRLLLLDGGTYGAKPGSGDDPEEIPFTGEVDFYDGNIAASGPGTYTANGEDEEWVEYKATFVAGRLREIRETRRERKPALPISRLPRHDESRRPTPEEIATWEARLAESLIGRMMYRLWGGQEEGYPVEIIAEGPKQWVGRKADGELELIGRGERDRIFFDSEADAKAQRQEQRSEREEQQREYDEYAREWEARRASLAPSASPAAPPHPEDDEERS